jgi:predicted phage tail protein
VLSGIAQLASPEQTDPFSRASDYLIEVLLATSFLLTLAGFVALHLCQAGSYGGPRGWMGFRAAVMGQSAILASALVSLAAGTLTLSFLYTAGVFVLLVGLALLSVATYRAAILPY